MWRLRRPARLMRPACQFNKRVLETSVLADDGQIVVLGGLLQESLSTTRKKVPVLGDAPLLGNLFRYDTHSRKKTNLMVFLRPTVLRSAAQTNVLSNERYRVLGLDQQAVTPRRSSHAAGNEQPDAADGYCRSATCQRSDTGYAEAMRHRALPTSAGLRLLPGR